MRHVNGTRLGSLGSLLPAWLKFSQALLYKYANLGLYYINSRWSNIAKISMFIIRVMYNFRAYNTTF